MMPLGPLTSPPQDAKERVRMGRGGEQWDGDRMRDDGRMDENRKKEWMKTERWRRGDIKSQLLDMISSLDGDH